METKGKAVDSVIQYQLHRESDGGSDFHVNISDPQEGQILTFDSQNEQWVNSNTRIKVVTVTMVEREATQEDVDNYMVCYDIAGDDIDDIEVGNPYRIFEISANYNEISKYDIVIIRYNGNFISKGYTLIEDFYSLFQVNGIESVKGTYYSLNINANLRQYIKENNV